MTWVRFRSCLRGQRATCSTEHKKKRKEVGVPVLLLFLALIWSVCHSALFGNIALEVAGCLLDWRLVPCFVLAGYVAGCSLVSEWTVGVGPSSWTVAPCG